MMSTPLFSCKMGRHHISLGRLRTLQQSSDSLPMSLVLVKDQHVIGHSKLTPLPAEPNACFVESVVIHPSYRKQGLGKALMNASENEAQKLGLHTVYLSTIDQQGFYLKLGYTECAPVSVYGCPIAKWNSSHTMVHNNMLSDLELQNEVSPLDSRTLTKDTVPLQHEATSLLPCQLPPPTPPPPPPPPPPPQSLPLAPTQKQRKTFMKKVL
ncbi:N-alpha-acetyltransferase 80 isoform X2 [Schistocerca serialis cubense]|uniref:N-alpha-acetyltransferase 80 isoform X2 n=1 Tax=Schistocerca serialis cubense TaxID=2023355 RepID=UPI00214EC1A6|nr:N-alpha-acetyltransferase 80 isoform X2 [Schistocerca serialis cubense]XP_049959765.1 N-alpha-acetyltransferase 80 isoform X2 [Schistocerca serialis cubense]XP_049959766.1 N-alpha-acetyltransferase 80 isoform X2 [Schistocerca serialis cubense]